MPSTSVVLAIGIPIAAAIVAFYPRSWVSVRWAVLYALIMLALELMDTIGERQARTSAAEGDEHYE